MNRKLAKNKKKIRYHSDNDLATSTTTDSSNNKVLDTDR